LTTRDLVVAVNNYYRKELKLPTEEVEVHKKLVHDYCLVKSEKEEKVFLEELSRYLDGDNPEGFLIYAQEKYEIPNEFQVDKLKLRKFLKYSGKDNSISISFSSEVFGTRVKYDANSDVMTIKGIPNALRELLMTELKEKKEA
jgi:nucleoid-associated protein